MLNKSTMFTDPKLLNGTVYQIYYVSLFFLSIKALRPRFRDVKTDASINAQMVVTHSVMVNSRRPATDTGKSVEIGKQI